MLFCNKCKRPLSECSTESVPVVRLDKLVALLERELSSAGLSPPYLLVEEVTKLAEAAQ